MESPGYLRLEDVTKKLEDAGWWWWSVVAGDSTEPAKVSYTPKRFTGATQIELGQHFGTPR